LAVNPVVHLVAYSRETELGVIAIGDTRYAFRCERLGNLLTRCRFVRPTGDGVKTIDVNLTDGRLQCDCQDAIYRSERPGDCKHVVSIHKADLLVQRPADDFGREDDGYDPREAAEDGPPSDFDPFPMTEADAMADSEAVAVLHPLGRSRAEAAFA
jgi:hypothetical protein